MTVLSNHATLPEVCGTRYNKTGYVGVDEVRPGRFRYRFGHSGAGPKTNCLRSPTFPTRQAAALARAEAKAAWERNRGATVIRRGQRALGPRSDVYFTNGELWHDVPPAQVTTPRAQLVKPTSRERDFHLYAEPFLRHIVSQEGDRAEIKWGTGAQALAQGVGQLKFAREFNGDTGRDFLIVPRQPDPEYVAVIGRLGVKLVVIPFP